MKKLLWLYFGFVAVSLVAAPLTLVKDGKPTASIVVAADKPSPAAQMAAFEIQHHIKLITGVELPIVNDKASVEGVKILVGDSAAIRTLGVKRGDFKGEEYMVKNAPGAIALMGNDTYNGKIVDYQNADTFPISYHFLPLDNATLWAAYDFLEQGCDVRHYAPSDFGITFTPRSTLTVEMRDCHRKPAMDAFRGFYAPKIFYERGKPFSDRDTLLLKLRWRSTERFAVCNHNVHSLWYKYYKRAKTSPYKEVFVESHPEYFAQGFAGKSAEFGISGMLRKEYPEDADLPPQPCLTNRAVIEHYAQEAVAAQAGIFAVGSTIRPRPLPGMPYFYPIELDDNLAACQCDNCRKMFPDKPQAERVSYLKWYWVNEIAKRTAEINPRVGIASLAYINSLPCPEGMKLAPNLAVQQCLDLQYWWHPMVYKAQHDQAYRAWMEKEGDRLITLWGYLLEPGYTAKYVYKYDDCFPGFYSANLAAIFKEFAADGVRGYFVETQNEIGLPLWYGQLEVYLTARLADDPKLDSEMSINDFFVRYYGAAAKPMREFHRIVEDAYCSPGSYPPELLKSPPNGRFTEDISWGSLGNKERMGKLGELIAEAKRLVQTPAEKQRLEWFDAGLWQSMLRGRANYEAKVKLRAQTVPELTVPKVAPANGDPAKLDWSKAVLAKRTTLSDGAVTPERTLRLAHDGEFLYVKYFEPGDATQLKIEKNLWSGDDLEFFFAAGTKRPYHQFIVNPAGKNAALAYYYENMQNYDGAWTAEAKVESRVASNGWTLLAAFPLAKLLPGGILKPGTEFRANFFRGMPEKPAQAWSPTFDNSFHVLERMGELKLAE